MQDAFAYCADLVRQADRDRFLAALFAPAEHRDGLMALYAFNVEVARVRELAREPLPGEIRLQWWREAIEGARGEEAAANPVAAAVLATLARYRLGSGVLAEMIEARRFDLYDEPMADIAELEAYAAKTASALIALGAQILGSEAAAAAASAGLAYCIVGVLRSLPLHASRRQLFVPSELLDRYGVAAGDVFAGRSSAGLVAVLADMRELARRHLDTAKQRLAALPPSALPAFLPVALLRPALARLDRAAPFRPVELSPWRRQWLIWRAARNPARIAG